LTVGAAYPRRQAVLCEIIAQHLESRLGGAAVRNPDLGGSLAAHDALINGRVDLYAECTGAALTVILKRPADRRPEVVLERVRLEYGRLQLQWLDPLGFEDGFVMVVRAEQARRLGLEKLSEAARVEGGWRLAAGREFLMQPDGMAALMQAYNLPLRGGPQAREAEAAYRALREGEADMVAGNATDGELAAEDLQVLADDRQGFPPGQAALVVRAEALARHADLRPAAAELAGRLSTARMRELNRRRQEGRPAAALAAEFLRSAGGGAPGGASRPVQ